MLNVKTPQEVLQIIEKEFNNLNKTETIHITKAAGRILAEDIFAPEDVPGFDRSSVDGFAIKAKDSFGCSESIPAILKLSGSTLMGEEGKSNLPSYSCVEIPTGAALPKGADAVVMIEYTERFSKDEIAVTKPVAPGENVVYRGDDCRQGQLLCQKGKVIKPADIGVMASLGISEVLVSQKPVAAIISTGDELIGIEEKPQQGKVRDVNSYAVKALLEEYGCETISYGFLKDDEKLLKSTIDDALKKADIVIISGGSSVGTKDATAKVIESYAPLLFHGIALKPGKPTIMGNAGGKAIVGLPGHPGASFIVTSLFVKPLVARLTGQSLKEFTVKAILNENVSANQGRAVYEGVRLEKIGGTYIANIIPGKSGLISMLSKSDGFICVPRDVEGYAKGTEVEVYLF